MTSPQLEFLYIIFSTIEVNNVLLNKERKLNNLKSK